MGKKINIVFYNFSVFLMFLFVIYMLAKYSYPCRHCNKYIININDNTNNTQICQDNGYIYSNDVLNQPKPFPCSFIFAFLLSVFLLSCFNFIVYIVKDSKEPYSASWNHIYTLETIDGSNITYEPHFQAYPQKINV